MGGGVIRRRGIQHPQLCDPEAMAQERAEKLRAIVAPLRDQGASIRAIVKALTVAGVETPQGGAWHPSSVARLLARLA